MARRSSVRRRVRTVDELVPKPISVVSAPAPWVDDYSLPARVRRLSFEAWFESFTQWQQARHEWADSNEWPGGYDAMLFEEPEVPNGPFDPDVV